MHHPAKSTRIKSARVFVSSTFSDMHAERDYLNRLVFPELRSRCMRHGIEFVGIDLRWGVTDKEIEQQGALSVCLDEIRRCNFFVSLIGDRYGWIPVPEEIPQEFFEAVREARDLTTKDVSLLREWYRLDETTEPPVYCLRHDRGVLDEVSEGLIHLWDAAGLPHAGDSIIAQEINEGVFEPSRSDARSFFYLRKSGLHLRPDFPEALVPIFVEQAPDHKKKLKHLKKRIQSLTDEKIKVGKYDGTYAGIRIDPTFLPPGIEDEARETLRDGVIHPEDLRVLSDAVQVAVKDHGTIALSGMEDLGQQITADLWAAIEAELKESDEPSDTTLHERPYHERFLTERTRLFLGRGDLLESMLGYAADTEDRQPLVITGKPGCGKSSLLAECARLCREQNPHALVLPHFIGAAPGSTDLTTTIRSLCETLRSECSLDYEISPDPEKLHHQLPVFLEKAGAKRPVILLIDAVNQLNPKNRSHELGWLPSHLPLGVRVIVSTLPGDCLDRLQELVSDDHILQVPALPKSDRESLIRMHLANRGKKLTEDQLARLLDTRKRANAGLPLYLLVALEELCLFGEYKSLDLRIDTLPATLPALFDQVLMRLEQDHTRNRAESILRLIAVSRSGLLESEILNLLKHDHIRNHNESILGWLTASRSNLRESEILDMLGKGKAEFSRVHWIQFYRSMEFYLRPVDETTGVGLIDFFHEQLSFAVYHRYLDITSPEAAPTVAYRRSHNQLADYFRGLASDGADPVRWCTDHPRSLSELPYHLLEAGRKKELQKMLFDFNWIQTKLEAIDANSLIMDYNFLPDDPDLHLVQGAIQLSAHVLARDKTQIAGQLLGRLQSFHVHKIRLMLEQARGWEGGMWLYPFNTSLTPPGGPLIRTFEGHTNSVKAVAVTPDGKHAISGSDDNTLKVWDIESGEELQRLEGHTRLINAVAVTPDGKRVISGSDDNTLKVWDLKNGELLWTLKGHTDLVITVAVMPDSRSAISASHDHTLKVWDLKSGELLRTLKDDGTVHAVAVMPDGRSAISASYENTLKVWDLKSGKALRTLRGRHTSWVRAIAVTPDGKHAISASDDNTLKVWDLKSGKALRTMRGHTGWVRAVAVTPDGRSAISGSLDKTLKVWDIESGEELRTLRGHTDMVYAVAVMPDSRSAISGSLDNTLKVWDIESEEELQTPKDYTGWVRAIAVTPDGRSAILASSDNTLKVWDIESGEDLQILEGHTDQVDAVAVTPNEKHAISASYDNTLKVWDLKSGKALRTMRGHTDSVSAVAVTSDGKNVISGSHDDTLKVWDIESGEEIQTLKGHSDPVDAVAVTPDGKYAISGSRDNTLRVWDLKSGMALRTMRGHTDSVRAVAVTPDGRSAISGSLDRTLKVWDIESEEELRTFEGHTSQIDAVAVTPDGKHAISASYDSTLKVQDIENGQILASFSGEDALIACAISPDGVTIVVGERSGRVYSLRLMGT